jgi:hypothetical protein
VPTYERLPRFNRDWDKLSDAERTAFKQAVKKFVADLERGGKFRKGLRVKGIKSAKGIFELTWANNGRATFEYGREVREGEPHVIWRRIGTHDVLDNA